MSTTYISLPESLEGDLKQRQEQLFLKVSSIEGNLYSLGAAVAECRKELTAIRQQLQASTKAGEK